MVLIIRCLLLYNQHLISQINELLLFISRSIPYRQWKHQDSHSPKYQKFKVDKLPTIIKFEPQDYKFLIDYYLWKYKKPLKPVNKRGSYTIADDVFCPKCNAPHNYLYQNNGGKGQFQCKVCSTTFHKSNRVAKPIKLKCPHCQNALEHKRNRLHFRIHRCVNNRCSYYKSNLRKLPKDLPIKERFKYKLRYIYREFTIDFFKMDLSQLPDWAFSFKFRKNSAHIMGLCLTYHVNLGLSTRKTAHALKEIHNVDISHTMVANYAKTAAVLIKPFVDNYDYNPSTELTADETYIKVKGLKGYVWFIADSVSRSILGYQVSNNRGVGPCILAMRMAFNKFKVFPDKSLRFIADGYSAYPLAAQQFAIEEDKEFSVTQVIGLTNVDQTSKIFRPHKQIIERLNRTFKASYRITCGYGNEDGAAYGLSLWVAYYNFLRPHSLINRRGTLNKVPELLKADNMPAKWQILMYLGQQNILKIQEADST